VSISSGAAAAVGGGLTVSTNVYIVGFSSAAKYYGDGSSLSGLAALADNLGNHIATTTLNMNGQQILNVSSLTVTYGISAGSATFSGNEGTTATITVQRVNGSSGAVSVDYATSDGTATAGSDYRTASGTLVFAQGETTKVFSVVGMLTDGQALVTRRPFRSPGSRPGRTPPAPRPRRLAMATTFPRKRPLDQASVLPQKRPPGDP
jgi:hypothetical protein